MYQGRKPLDGREGPGLDVESKADRETDGPQQAQMILAEALFGIADGAYDLCREIGTAAGEIQNFTGEGIEQECVDGEIAAQDILSGIRFEGNAFRMPAVAIFKVAAKGGDFNLPVSFGTLFTNKHHTKVGTNLASSWKQAQKGIGRRGGSDVKILRGAAEQKVPNASTCEISDISRTA
jgi:hypothetical protein